MSQNMTVRTPELTIKMIGDQNVVRTNRKITKVRHEGLCVYHASGPRSHNKKCELTFVPECMTVISPVDDRSKFSSGYAQCIGVAALGQSKETGKVLSLLVHGNPECWFQSNYRADRPALLREKLQASLSKLCDQSIPGSVATYIFGGETKPHWSAEERSFAKRMEYLRSMMEDVVGCPPTVILPKFDRPFNSSFYLDTQERQAVLVQPLPTRIEVPSSFSAAKVCCEQLRWSIAARRKFGKPFMGCYPFVEPW